MRGVAGIDVGAARQFETPLLELGGAWPSVCQSRIKLLGLRAEEVQLVLGWTAPTASNVPD